MKYGQVETEKICFSSNEVAEKVGISVKTLRSWEKIYSELRPKISGAGKRIYRLSDIEAAKKIKRERGEASIFGEETAKPKTAKEKQIKSNGVNKYNKELLREIRDNLQYALDKIKK